MPITAQYETFYGIHLNHVTESWGGIDYSKLLVKDVPDVECVSTSTTSSTATIYFLIPDLIKSKYFLDGKAYGHFHLWNISSTVSSTVTDVTITLQVVNNAGTTRDIGVYTKTITYIIWKNDIIAIPFFMELSKVEITENEKIRLAIFSTASTTIYFSHDIEQAVGDYDVKLVLPFAPTS